MVLFLQSPFPFQAVKLAISRFLCTHNTFTVDNDACMFDMKTLHMWNKTCSNSKKTAQLRRKATWEKGLTAETQTRVLRSNAKFHPREL